ncbi:unnamed protein product [Linum trigynum]|uniref:Uncharacterized protein n=1 Tax=Linum trigynum TaxID=586398 RepID=A0AAV2DTE9_9ROSI
MKTLKLVPDRKPAFLVNLEYCNKPIGCQKCRVFGHQCENSGGEGEGDQGIQGNIEIGGVEAVAGSAGQLILDSILALKGCVLWSCLLRVSFRAMVGQPSSPSTGEGPITLRL